MAIRYEGTVRSIIHYDQLLNLKSKTPISGTGQYMITVIRKNVFFAVRDYVIGYLLL